ncbi:iron complex transport system substrate-binding protein [Neomicrococcus aestuarii]|uniref:Iron complex transport system substrate-binding protein n=1 Tax=Neomicrococcus aestuarii TaxID=556325 RepID=A0A7W8TTZ0_9MICC|nr:ABC transporter substrate-binding protein [Neomicrococcus aestuarii]MBB5512867.1 iron complex transport system substrate-binding protein [Neomicrococcus aestuarii]
MELTRRSALLAFATTAALGLSACATSTTGTSSSSASGSSTTAAFPVTVKHIYGETVIDAAPAKIATVSWVNADVVLALGVVPAGMAKDAWGQNANNSTDWKDAKLKELGAEIGSDNAPVQYDEADGINFDEIAKLQPDLIVAAYSGLTQEEYTKLSRIAKVIGPVAAAYTAPWQDSTLAIGQALGKESEAKALIETVEKQLTDAGEANPVLKESTYIAGNLEPATGGINIYTSGDNRSRFLSSLGMTESPIVEANKEADAFYFNWSAERADELAADVFFTWLPEGTTVDDVKNDSLLGQIPAAKTGGLVAESSQALTLAVSASSPLSLPWALDQVVPNIVKGAEAAKAAK